MERGQPRRHRPDPGAVPAHPRPRSRALYRGCRCRARKPAMGPARLCRGRAGRPRARDCAADPAPCAGARERRNRPPTDRHDSGQRRKRGTMTRSISNRIACLALTLAAMSAPMALAQDFSPYFETTGRGAYDLYNDTVLCNAVLERAFEAEPKSKQRAQIEQGINYTASFAQFLLESGDVVDMSGAILAPDNLPIDRRNARADWQAVLSSLEDEGEAPDAEIGRCLRLYGHDWE